MIVECRPASTQPHITHPTAFQDKRVARPPTGSETDPLDLDRARLEALAADIPTDGVSFHYVENFFGRAKAWKLLAETGRYNPENTTSASVTRRDFWQFCLKNINAHDDEGHGCTSRPLPKSTWQMIFSAVNQMDNLSEGLRQFAELVPTIRAGIAVSVGYGRHGVHLNFMAAQQPQNPERLDRYLELIALVFHCVLLWITNHGIHPAQIRLSSLLADEDGSLLAGLAPIIVRQGEGVTIVYERDDMKLPLGVRKYQHWSNETKAFEELSTTPPSQQDEGDVIIGQVRHLVAMRSLTLQQAAPAIGMSIGTLQRRLRESGTSFRQISREIRCEKLISLLATDIDLDDVAEELGLSERRSLWRTCQEWLGVSPSEYRRTQTAALARLS